MARETAGNLLRGVARARIHDDDFIHQGSNGRETIREIVLLIADHHDQRDSGPGAVHGDVVPSRWDKFCGRLVRGDEGRMSAV